MKIKKGDTVVVIAGKDKGAKGKVIAAYPRMDKVLVEGVNRVKKHTRIRTTQRGAKTGGIITQEAAIHVSNVMVVDTEGNPTRVGSRLDDTKSMTRSATSSSTRCPPGFRTTSIACSPFIGMSRTRLNMIARSRSRSPSRSGRKSSRNVSTIR